MVSLINKIIEKECLFEKINIINCDENIVIKNSMKNIRFNDKINKFNYSIILNSLNDLNDYKNNTINKIIIILNKNNEFKNLFKLITINKIYLLENYYVAVSEL